MGLLSPLYTDEFLDTLQLGADGVTAPNPANPITTGGVLRLTGPNDTDIYDSTVIHLEREGYGLNSTLFLWAYDWRKDIPTNADALLNYIDTVRRATGSPVVDLLGHSQGGLLALVALSRFNTVNRVRKVVTLGAPILGSAKSLGLVHFAEPCFVERLGVCLYNKLAVRNALRNAPAAYQLAPGALYDDAIGVAVNLNYDRDRDGRVEGNLSHAQWLEVVSQERNRNLAATNELFHNRYDKATPLDRLVQVVRVVGANTPTIETIQQYIFCPMMGPCEFRYTLYLTSGDGTVQQHAADLCNPAKSFDERRGIPNKLFNRVEHSDLAINPDVLNFVVGYFKGTIAVAPSPECERLPRSTADDEQHAVELEVHGPLDAEIADAHNRTFHPGQQEVDPTTAIPGMNYFDLRPSQSFYIQGHDSYTATLQVAGARDMTLRVKTFTDWERQTSATFDLLERDAPIGTRLVIRFATRLDPSTLRLEIDRDADGSIDAVIAPSAIETAQP